MAETTMSNTQSLRRLVPRMFQRAGASRDAVDTLVRTLKQSDSRADTQLVLRAYDVAKRHHEGQTRKSGEPYITHPLAVAQILADLGAGSRTVAAALLHDTVEDTDYALDELASEFGDDIAMLVDGVTKLDKVKYGDAAQAETVRKMVIAMAKDIRVLLIKLADRLHNARTWGFVSGASAERKAKETLEIYAPLAHRLGIQAIKTELEELSFAVMQPKIYAEIDSLVRQRTPKHQEFIDQVTEQIRSDLRANRIKGTVAGRPKQYYSIYQKMVVRGRDFDDIYDLTGIRVLVDTVRDCYAVLGAVHARWSPMPGRFKDYIATPKFNLYQSLHTTVIGPDGKPVEIQIRTHEMHQRAELGVAAHWKYKQKTPGEREPSLAKSTDLAWLAHISDWQEETKDPSEFLDNLRFEVGAKDVYVFTPHGKVIGLPTGATPVDFAYSVHTDVGHRTMGAKVNGRLVPLETKLVSGDVVEVFTSKNPDAGPKQDWLQFVASNRARTKIRQWFTKERRDEAVEQGKDALTRALRKQHMPLHSVLSSAVLDTVATSMRYADITALYAAIGEGHVSTQSVIEKITHERDQTAAVSDDEEFQLSGSLQERQDATSGVLVRGAPDILVKLAKCCTPVPGDQIVGFITRGQGVSVHQTSCPNVVDMETNQPDRLIEVSWAKHSKSVFLVHIQVEALDRAGLLSDVTRVLSDLHVNILSASVQTSRDRLAISRFIFEMGNIEHLDSVFNAVRRIDGVYDVARVSG